MGGGLRDRPPALPGPAIAQTLASLFAAEQFDAWVIRRYPPVIRMRILGVGEVVVVRHPEDVQSLFTAGPAAVRSGEINRRVVPAVGEQSLMMLDGDEHMRLRRLLLPAFHGEAVRNHQALIENIARSEVGRWPAREEFAAHPRMLALTLEVILSVVLGVEDAGRRERLRLLLPRVLEVNPVTVLLEGRFRWLRSGRAASLRPLVRARREAEALLAAEVRERRERPGDDVLSMLLAAESEDGGHLSDAEIQAQLMTLLLAGHETTASVLAWCLMRIARDPDAADRIRGAGDDADAYLGAYIEEVMRVQPVVEVVWRVAAKPIELGGYAIPPGTVIAAVIRAIGRHGLTDPGAFRPERHLESESAPYSLVPFGGGTRRCLGASFAVQEMRTVLRTILAERDLGVTDASPERASRTQRFTVSPHRGAAIVATPRPG